MAKISNQDFYRFLRDLKQPVYWDLGEGETPVSKVMIKENGQMVEVGSIVHNTWSAPYSPNEYYKLIP